MHLAAVERPARIDGVAGMPHIRLPQLVSVPARRPFELTSIDSVEQLEVALSEPTDQVIEALGRLQGDLLLLGAGGKMGPSLARMAKRASDAAGIDRRVIAVSRFSDARARAMFEQHGIETIACDLLDQEQLDRLPACENVILMTGFKFGSSGRESHAWATNCLLTGMVGRRFRHSRIVAFSTGNIYGLTPVERGGSQEADPPTPLGDYAMSCLGRERLLDYASTAWQVPTVIVRLNYACELRYGILVDLAEKVWSEQPVDLSMGYVNVIWQADANAMALAAFEIAAVPPAVINVTGCELLSVRESCDQFGQLFDKAVTYRQQPAADALLSNSQRAVELFGPPRWTAADIIPAVARWVRCGRERLGKPTHFQARHGNF
jgi:hypothetical protein